MIRFIAVLLLIAIALGVAFGAETLMLSAEEKLYPRKYSEYVTKYSREYNIPEYVIYAVIKTESDFDPNARSSAGACGLMQIMPETFEWLTGKEHLNENLQYDSVFIPEVSIRYGTYYLMYLYKKFDYNWDTAFAAYNGGEGNVSKWLKDPEYADGEGGLKHIPDPYGETRRYVPKVNNAIEKYKKLYYEPNEEVLA